MAEKVTVMVLNVDLQCRCSYKKVKKILCKFPQIRDQVYNEKAKTVTITVVCCNPEKIRDKLCCKGSKLIKSIEIKDPPKPEPKPEVKPSQEKKDDTKPDPKPTPTPPPAPGPIIFLGCPPNYPIPMRTCCGPCSEGHGGGPCYHGNGVPLPPPPCYDGYYGYGYGQRSCYVSRCDYYFCEDNRPGCSIM